MATVTLMPGFEVGRPAALSREVKPRMQVKPPTGDIPGPKKTIPTSSQSNKKTNNAIVYTRVVSDASLLSLHTGAAKSSFQEGFLVFVKGRSCDDYNAPNGPLVNSLESAHSILSNMEHVNAEMMDDDKNATWRAGCSWRLDGVFKGADLEIGNAPHNSNSAILVTLAGPTILKNIYVARPMHGDIVYIGLVVDLIEETSEWVPFSSQDLVSLSKGYEAPSLPRSGAQWQQAKTFPFAGEKTQTHPIPPQYRLVGGERKTECYHCHKFSSEDAKNLLLAYRIGRIVDANHAPGEIRVNVQISPVSTIELGLAYDPKDIKTEFTMADPLKGHKESTRLITFETFIGKNFRGADLNLIRQLDSVARSHHVGWMPYGEVAK